MKKKLVVPTRMIHQATRYLLGRVTYAVGEHCEWLIKNWKQLPASEQSLIKKAVEEAFARDEMHPNEEHGPLGMDVDKKDWESVRALWTTSTVE